MPRSYLGSNRHRHCVYVRRFQASCPRESRKRTEGSPAHPRRNALAAQLRGEPVVPLQVSGGAFDV